MTQTIDDLVEWADEEGGPLSLFYYRCVNLDCFDLTEKQYSDLERMSALFEEAMSIWALYS